MGWAAAKQTAHTIYILTRLPYAPSHLLPLSSLTAASSFAGPSRSSTLSSGPQAHSGPPVRNIIDMAFLPGFNEPTLALLYAPEPTWTGRLENMQTNCLVSLVTLATTSSAAGSTTTAVVIATSPALPHSCLSLHPCPPALGGALVLTANGLLHLEQSGKLLGLSTNAWFPREYSGPTSPTPAAHLREGLEGARVAFVSNSKAVVFARSGAVLELQMEVSGRSVSGMRLDRVGQGVAASCVERVRGSRGRFGEHGFMFVGSEVGESAVVRWEIGSGAGGRTDPVPVEDDGMELDDEDGAPALNATL